ncbi:MAG: IS66 family transposase, partial [Bradymonadaceae bacterium]
EALLHEANTHGDKAPAVVRWLLQPKHLNLAWTFLDHPDVEPTNNTTERALRGPVLQRKVSWGSRSEAGMRLMERLWTTAETRRIQGRSLLAYLTEAIDAWRKGAPAPILV